jgi:hypothetical protein
MRHNNAILAPGIGMTIPFRSADAIGQEAHEIALGQGAWRLYVMGWVEYGDDLGQVRRTSFCREFRPNIVAGRVSGTGRMHPVDDQDYERED